MSTRAACDVEVAVIGAGVVGSAVALALGRRGAAVALLEAEAEPAAGASGANSGILHTGFHSAPNDLETQLILKSVAAREALLEALEVPLLRCGALLAPHDERERQAVVATAECNRVPVRGREDGALEIPGEWVTDPVVYTVALAAEAHRQGVDVRKRFRVCAIEPGGGRMTLRSEDDRALTCRVVVNCAGLEADTVARLAGDDSFSIYPRKGEFLVYDAPGGRPLKRILLPVPTDRTRGVLVFPTVDGAVIAGPTAVDLDDKRDWSVGPDARAKIMPKAVALYPELEGAEPIATYAGLRPAGRGVNYLIGPSRACPALVNVAAIRSTGLSASLAIGAYVAGVVSKLGVHVGSDERALIGGPAPTSAATWWSRAASRAAVA